MELDRYLFLWEANEHLSNNGWLDICYMQLRGQWEMQFVCFHQNWCERSMRWNILANKTISILERKRAKLIILPAHLTHAFASYKIKFVAQMLPITFNHCDMFVCRTNKRRHFLKCFRLLLCWIWDHSFCATLFSIQHGCTS